MTAGLDAIVLLAPTGTLTVLTSEGEERRPRREASGVDAFAAALARHTTADVTVVDGPVPSNGGRVVVLGEEQALDRTEVAPTHQVLLHTYPSGTLAGLRRRHAAAAVTAPRWEAWRADPAGDSGHGLHGLVTVAERLGAGWLFADGPYCLMDLPAAPDLPALLAAYLDAWSALDHGDLGPPG